jgi:hypothetical protein
MANTTDLAENLAFSAQSAIRREEYARNILTEAITAGTVIDAYTLRPMLTAQANAMPWRKVVARIKKAGAARALESVREECTELLTERSESRSTCAITNETDRIAREAAREFLRATRRMG